MTQLKMKQLEERTGVGRETIRFYIREGILPEPEKPRRNVAHYSEAHVSRLRLIRKLQEEKFLPLGVIKNLFDQADVDQLSENLASFELNWLTMMGVGSETELTVADAAERTGMTEAEISELHERGVVDIHDGCLSAADVSILDKWSEIQQAGFTAGIGYDAGFLEMYCEKLSAIAEREVSLFLSGFADQDAELSAATASTGVALANELLTRVHTRALRQLIRRQVSDTTS